ncbi:hypothetical protein Gasu2_40420 [Galdieria sulphuraria]|uniref:Glycine-rich domain-containing protein n=1 Tax=Galdieria sulphuraria TaxID=130081 RepID=M2XVC9_GALSU|nr:uncharacterized protein Gasu_49100 [Galdieria sulphuraria]EME27618.1 hypothetical protein Gasu_49100 [Galdieria sulphuraria]GJD09812.1 hypothetical protein Gasu2_40420 [Galdieria sulphuraria]|eukprot:XP_005704138.1 hypothetical protein Gasu_49100 [Galdieria sulphuraria]
MLGKCRQISYSYPSTYTVQVPRGPDVHVIFGSKVLLGNRTLYKVFATTVFPPVSITVNIPDCRESGFGETSLKVDDILMNTSFAPELCPQENDPLIEERVYESFQGTHRIRFRGYLEENSLEPFFQDEAPASFLTQVGQARPHVFRSYDSPGLYTVTVSAGVHKARGLVIGGGGGGGAGGCSLVTSCSATPVGGGGGGAGGTAFGDTTVAPGDKLKVYVGKGGSGGNPGCGGGDGTFSGFVRLSGGGGRGGNPGSTSGPGSGGTGGGASGRTVKEGGSGSNGAASQGGSGGNPYEYELYNNGEGGIGGSYFGDVGQPGKAGLVHVIFDPSSSVMDIEHFRKEYEKLAQRCGFFSIIAGGLSHLYETPDDYTKAFSSI